MKAVFKSLLRRPEFDILCHSRTNSRLSSARSEVVPRRIPAQLFKLARLFLSLQVFFADEHDPKLSFVTTRQIQGCSLAYVHAVTLEGAGQQCDRASSVCAVLCLEGNRQRSAPC